MTRAPDVRFWTRAELVWGRECQQAGDSVEEIAEWADCSRAEVVANLGPGRLSEQQREVVSLYVIGCSFEEIGLEMGQCGRKPGKAPASMITKLRRDGYPIPYRCEAMVRA